MKTPDFKSVSGKKLSPSINSHAFLVAILIVFVLSGVAHANAAVVPVQIPALYLTLRNNDFRWSLNKIFSRPWANTSDTVRLNREIQCLSAIWRAA